MCTKVKKKKKWVMDDQHSAIRNKCQGGGTNGCVVPLNKWHFPPRLCLSSISLHPPPFFVSQQHSKHVRFFFMERIQWLIPPRPWPPPIHLLSGALVTADSGRTHCLGWHWRSNPWKHSAGPVSPPLPKHSLQTENRIPIFLPFPSEADVVEAESLRVFVSVFTRGLLWLQISELSGELTVRRGQQNAPPTRPTDSSSSISLFWDVMVEENQMCLHLIYRWTVSHSADPRQTLSDVWFTRRF